MGLILLSLLFFAIGAFAFLTSVNYAWVLWEKERVDNLTKQIRPNQEDDLFKRNQVREYTQSFDIRNVGRTGINKAQKAYEKTMVAISDGGYPTWVTKALEIVDSVRKDFVLSVKTFISYLLHLAKPDEESTKVQNLDEEMEEREVEETIARVREASSDDFYQNDNSSNEKDLVEDSNLQDNREHHDEMHQSEQSFHTNDSSPIRVTLNSQSQDKTATISLSSSGTQSSSDKTKQTNAAFEKLEARILDKLKQSGLNHYAIWLELGELYIKYEERDKASEVFALVLKNTKNEKEKEAARNRLIGL